MAISITKPTVGGSEDTWGTTINTALDTIVDGVNGTSGTIAPDLSTLTINGTDVTATAAELNKLDGVTATTAELNILDGVTATAAEINKLDGVTATTAELNILDGVTATTAELNYVDGVTSNIQTQLDAKLESHPSISAASSVNNSGSTFIQDITLDSNGHVTGLTSAALGAVAGTFSLGGIVNGTRIESLGSSSNPRLYIGRMVQSSSRTGTWSGTGTSAYYAAVFGNASNQYIATSAGGNFQMSANYSDPQHYQCFILLDTGMTLSTTSGANQSPPFYGLYFDIAE